MHVLPLKTPTLPPATTTNTIIVSGWVVDPATPYPEPRATLLAAVREAGARGIVLTHHHRDHMGAAAWLAAETGLPIAAHPRTAELLAGQVTVDVPLHDGDELPGAAAWTVLHTPGHASGHIVLWSAVTRELIAGDMVASVGTIVIDPPDGHMATYLAQLERLRALDAALVVPSHGAPITNAHQVFSFYLAHRAERREKVFAAVTDLPQSLREVTQAAYRDVAPALLPLAERSALAHLIELSELGRIRAEDGTWRH